jgi:hypothetical protein
VWYLSRSELELESGSVFGEERLDTLVGAGFIERSVQYTDLRLNKISRTGLGISNGLYK